MRWRSREEPCGSHHVDARALKCDTSVGLTDDEREEWRRRCVRGSVVGARYFIAARRVSVFG